MQSVANPMDENSEKERVPEDQELVPVPPGILSLCHLFAGASSQGTRFLANGMCVVAGLSHSYWWYTFMLGVHPNLLIAGWAGLCTCWFLIGSTIIPAHLLRAELLDSDSERNLSTFLKSNVSAETAASLETQLLFVGKLGPIGHACFWSVFFFVMLFVVMGDDVGSDLLLSSTINAAGNIAFCGRIIFHPFVSIVLCSVLADRARRLARQVSRLSQQADGFDVIIKEAHSLAVDIDVAGRLLKPLILWSIATLLSISVALVVVGTGPQPPAGTIYATYCPPALFLVMSAVILLFAIYATLLPAASLTHECDEILISINDLRLNKPKTGIASGDDLARIEALERYLGRVFGDGLGFHLLSFRITFSFLYSLLTSAFQTFSIAIPVMLALAAKTTDARVTDGSTGA